MGESREPRWRGEPRQRASEGLHRGSARGGPHLVESYAMRQRLAFLCSPPVRFFILATLCAVAVCAAAIDPVYVNAAAGKDSNDGSKANPVQTLSAAIKLLQPSGTVLLANGSYQFPNMYWKDKNCMLPPGTPQAYTTIAADEGHVPVLAGQIAIDCSNATAPQMVPHHVEFRGLVIKPREMPGYTPKTILDCGHIDGLPFLRLKDLECAWAPDQGFFLGSCDNAELLNLNIHHCGLICAGMSLPDFCHGVYSCQGDNVLIEGCHIHHNAGEGVQIWSGDKGERMTRNVSVLSNVINDNGNCIRADGKRCRGTGIGLYSGSGHSARNNIVYGNAPGISVDYGATHAIVEDNTVFNNSIAGIYVGDGRQGTTAAATVRSNQIYGLPPGNETASNGWGPETAPGVWIDQTSATVSGNLLFGMTIQDDSNRTATIGGNFVLPVDAGASLSAPGVL